MTTPCPLYFKPADFLAAFSRGLDIDAEHQPVERHPRRFALWRPTAALSSAVRQSRYLLSRRPAGSGPSSAPAGALNSAHKAPDLRQVAAVTPMPSVTAARGLLSHFAMIQTGT